MQTVFGQLAVILTDFGGCQLDFTDQLALHLFHSLLLHDHFLTFVLQLGNLFTEIFLQLFLRSHLVDCEIDPTIRLLDHLVFTHFHTIDLRLVQKQLLYCHLFGEHAIRVTVKTLSLVLQI